MLPLFYSKFVLINKIVHWFRVPVPPRLSGFLFLATYAASKLFVTIFNPGDPTEACIDEMKGSFYAVIFFGVAHLFSHAFSRAVDWGSRVEWRRWREFFCGQVISFQTSLTRDFGWVCPSAHDFVKVL